MTAAARSTEVVAERFGYRSEAAFCRAFKREFCTSPGRDRRLGPTPRLPG